MTVIDGSVMASEEAPVDHTPLSKLEVLLNKALELSYVNKAARSSLREAIQNGPLAIFCSSGRPSDVDDACLRRLKARNKELREASKKLSQSAKTKMRHLGKYGERRCGAV